MVAKSLRSGNFPPMGDKERKLQVRPCFIQVLRHPTKEKNDPETGAHGLFISCKDV